MKKCKIDNCSSNCFTHGFCYNHRYLYYGLDKIKPLSTKRKEQTQIYLSMRKSIIEELVSGKEPAVCFFCRQKLKVEPDIHHLFGRDEDLLTDRSNLVPVHHSCHMEYHQLPITKLMAKKWYNYFMKRIKILVPLLHEKELNKQSKI